MGQDTESFLFGLRNSSTSKLAFNDWRLKFYLQSDFPDIFRPVLQVGAPSHAFNTHSHACVHCCGACAAMAGPWRVATERPFPHPYVLPPFPCSVPQGPDDFYRIGEIVESSQQKTMVCKARVFEVRRNHTYDIRYATAHGTDSAAGLQAGCWVSTSHLTAHRSPPSLLCNPSTATSMTMLLMCVLL